MQKLGLVAAGLEAIFNGGGLQIVHQDVRVIDPFAIFVFAPRPFELKIRFCGEPLKGVTLNWMIQ